MPEIFDFDKNNRTFAGWAFIVSLEKLEGEEQKKFFEESKGKPIEIELKVNGHEVSFSSIMRRIDEEKDRLIEISAAELVQNRMGEIETSLMELNNLVKEKTHQMFSLSPQPD